MCIRDSVYPNQFFNACFFLCLLNMEVLTIFLNVMHQIVLMFICELRQYFGYQSIKKLGALTIKRWALSSSGHSSHATPSSLNQVSCWRLLLLQRSVKKLALTLLRRYVLGLALCIRSQTRCSVVRDASNKAVATLVTCFQCLPDGQCDSLH